MEWLNYHHLLYFWLVAREGSLARASKELRLAQSTVSKQIHAFEEVLGHKLFAKSGRRLVLTDVGKIAFRYAQDIFSLGREFQDTLNDRPVGNPIRATIGVADIVPKMLVQLVLERALAIPEPIRLICREDKPDRLLADLALHEFDVILTDAPASTNINAKVFNHLLGTSDVSFFACPEIASRFQGDFPNSLKGAPMLLPTQNTVLRRSLDQWFQEKEILLNIIAEFEDSALLMAFGQKGMGIFPALSIIAPEIANQYKVEVIGRTPDVLERLYAITVERKIVHPAIVAICEATKDLIAQSQMKGKRPPKKSSKVS